MRLRSRRSCHPRPRAEPPRDRRRPAGKRVKHGDAPAGSSGRSSRVECAPGTSRPDSVAVTTLDQWGSWTSSRESIAVELVEHVERYCACAVEGTGERRQKQSDCDDTGRKSALLCFRCSQLREGRSGTLPHSTSLAMARTPIGQRNRTKATEWRESVSKEPLDAMVMWRSSHMTSSVARERRYRRSASEAPVICHGHRYPRGFDLSSIPALWQSRQGCEVAGSL